MVTRDIKIKALIGLFFGITAILIFAEYLKIQQIVFYAKPLLIPCLFTLYIIRSSKICPYYIAALFFAFLSNIFFMFPDAKLLLYGIIAFLFYRITSIFAVLKNGDRIALLPLFLATAPFLFMFSYLIDIMVPPENPSFYATIVNDVIISIFCGIGLSNYVMNDNKQNSWLLISTLLFTFLVILFMFDKFYLSFQIFKPLSALVFSLAHFAFLKFMEEAEN
jgi:YhhN family